MYQTALGLQDLGSFYHTPVKDTNGSIVLVTIATVADVKHVSTAHCRWIPFSKAMKRIATNDVFAAPEMLLQDAQVRTAEMTSYTSSILDFCLLLPILFIVCFTLLSTVFWHRRII